VSSIKVKELAKGIQLCVENAADLIEDARLLFNKNRFARCFSLCVLAMEEIGKIEVIARGVLISKTDEKKWKRFEKNFKSHEIKQAHAIVMQFAETLRSEGAKGVKQRLSAPGRFTLDQAKQLSFYVDFLDGKFVSPRTMISKDLGREALARAGKTVRQYANLSKSTNLVSLLIKFKKEAPNRWETDQELLALKQILSRSLEK